MTNSPNPEAIKAALEISNKITDDIKQLANLCQLAGFEREVHKLIAVKGGLRDIFALLEKRRDDLQS